MPDRSDAGPSARALLVYPRFPTGYWGLQYMMPLVGRKSLMPPLALITIAAMLPPEWEPRLVDLNAAELTDADLAWADVVLLGGMLVQRPSFEEVTARCRAHGIRTIAGGPMVSALPDSFADIDCVVVGEAEDVMAELLADFAAGQLRRRYVAEKGSVDPARSPVPRYDLLPRDAYLHMCVQFSRGCPFSCEFCDIIEMYGRKPRSKTPDQILAELDAILATGWRGSVFMVDDNFIGHKGRTKDLLRAVAGWQRARGSPFAFVTEASINLAWDDELLELMVAAGFYNVFMGIETPSTESLRQAGKLQNLRMDLVEAVHRIIGAGIDVSGGFIVGFDEDDETIFDRQIDFIQRSLVTHATVGTLTALPGTQLERRLRREGRLREVSGGNFFALPNFVPRMGDAPLIEGYRRVLAAIYRPQAYFERCLGAMLMAGPPRPSQYRPTRGIGLRHLRALAASLIVQGVLSDYRRDYWAFLWQVVRRVPARFPHAIIEALYGHHLIEYTRRDVLPALRGPAAGDVREVA